MSQSTEPHLKRELGIFQATVINMIDMVGIGPFVVLPLVIQMMGGNGFIYAWLAGALLSVVDAMIWSELGAALPRAGGSFYFLREAYGEKKAGRLMSFLYVWQTSIQAPLVVASGAIGFAQYFNYLWPVGLIGSKVVSGMVVLLLTAILYRKIESIGKISVLLWVGVIGTLLAIIGSGVVAGDWHRVGNILSTPPAFTSAFGAVLGMATVKTIYSYLGYYNVCHLGGEIRNPGKNIPASMFLSIAGIAILYLLLNLSVVSVISPEEAGRSTFIVSTFIEHLYGPKAAMLATVLVLWIAFASLFAVMLGYSRVPYAAAREGEFFEVFSKVHPKHHFPHVSLVVLGALAFVFSLLFKLSEVITAILAMRIVIQFIGQAAGLMVLRKRKPAGFFPFKMPLYPIPVVLAIGIWMWIFISTGRAYMLGGMTVIATGIIAFLIKAGVEKHWPFTIQQS